ncbi:Plug domain-containing protein [Novosphingobium sp.]|uniref:TonB-dependent receptor n=1 Tax=Novosphingobium sp. TaxID=1874826 RepID=UPI0034210114
MSTLARDRTAASASGRIEDALASLAGFQQFRRSDSRSANPTAQGATLRGLGGNASSRTLVVLDGVPVSDPFFGHVPFSALPMERLERVTLVRGGGSGALGRARWRGRWN